MKYNTVLKTSIFVPYLSWILEDLQKHDNWWQEVVLSSPVSQQSEFHMQISGPHPLQ